MQKHVVPSKTRMVRKQIYITAEQDRQLKDLAKAEGVPAAIIVRRGLQHALEHVDEAAQLAAWKARLLKIKPIWKDRDNIHEEMQDLRKGWGRRAKRLGLDTGKPE